MAQRRCRASRLRSWPLRADVRPNRHVLLARAREVFAAGGFDLRFDDFAPLAGVGTLCRHFATREALAEAVYREEHTASAVDLAQGWVFHGDGARFASAVFEDCDDALSWVARHQLTGIVTAYTLGEGCYALVLEQGRFHPTKPHHGTAARVAGFSPAGPHIHVRNGHPPDRSRGALVSARSATEQTSTFQPL